MHYGREGMAAKKRKENEDVGVNYEGERKTKQRENCIKMCVQGPEIALRIFVRQENLIYI